MKLHILIPFCLFTLFTLFPLKAAELPPGAALVKTIDWSKETLPAVAELGAGSPEIGPFISVANGEGNPVSVTLFSLKPPGIQTKAYAFRGRIRYREVEGAGYLQLWNEFSGETAGAPPARYFSRTLADAGLLQKIAGSSEWRYVLVPFDASKSKTLPSALQFDLVLPGRGAVDLANLELLQFADPGAMWALMGIENGASGSSFPKAWLPAMALCAGTAALAAGIVLVRRRKVAEIRRMRAMDFR